MRSLWRLYQKESGWFIGDDMQDRRLLVAADEGEMLSDLPVERAPTTTTTSLTEVGEAEW